MTTINVKKLAKAIKEKQDKAPVSFYLKVEQYDEFQASCELLGVSASQAIESLVESFLESARKEIPKADLERVVAERKKKRESKKKGFHKVKRKPVKRSK